MSRAWRTRCLAGYLLLTLVGCGGENYAPVSGTVTLDGEPLADAKLIFEPIGDASGTAAGKVSYGRTDTAGHFTLTCPVAATAGAAVGEHRVRVVTAMANDPTPEQMTAARAKLQAEEKAGGSDAIVTDERVREYLSDTVQTSRREQLPAHYNTATTLTFTVPASGTEQADFPLTAQ